VGFVHCGRMVWTYDSWCVPAFVEGKFLGDSVEPGSNGLATSAVLGLLLM
jgi:hypothetical protein